jgi:hypothetical protein
LNDRNGEVNGAPALAAVHRLEVVLVALAPAVVEHVARPVRRFEVISEKGKVMLKVKLI